MQGVGVVFRRRESVRALANVLATAFVSLRYVVGGLALALAAGVTAQHLPRVEAINGIIAAQRAVDLPLFRQHGMPLLARAEAKELLAATGKSFRLGPEWRPGNPFWERAETILFHDRVRAYEAAILPDAAGEKDARSTLDKLTDAQLSEVLRFYQSDVFRKFVRYSDMALASLALSKGKSTGEVPPAMRDELASFAKVELTKEELRQLETALSSSAFQVLRQGFLGRLLQSTSTAAVAGVPVGSGAKRYVGEVVVQFRKAHGDSTPPPPVYESDFTYNRVVEMEYRGLADAAGRGDTKALERLKRSAYAANPVAQVELGRLYSLGRGVPQNPELSFAWTNRAAIQGMPRAVYNLAVHYQNGVGVPKDLPKAVQYFQQSADRKFARAQLALGLLYRHGTGVPQDFEASLRLIRAAIDQELPAAYLALAEAYDAGAGVFRDVKEADIWLGKAIRQEYAPAVVYRSERRQRSAELAALVAKSPPSAKGVPAFIDKTEVNKRLLQAAREGNIALAKLALHSGADVHAADVVRPYDGDTPLHHAARSGNIELAEMLIGKGADPNVRGPSGYTPLHVAAGLRRQPMAEYLLNAGANPNALDRRGTPLHAATVQGHAEMVAMLLARGADPNARDLSKHTPLHVIGDVARYFPSHTSIARLLANGGADLFAVAGSDDYARTAFASALERGGQEVAMALLESNAKLTPSNPAAQTLAVAFAGHGYLDALQALEAKGISLAATSARGETALHRAAAANRTAVVKYLLSKGLDIGAKMVNGNTPLHRAAENGHVGMVAFLLDQGAPREAVNQLGWSPLASAIFHYRDGAAGRLLIERNANTNVRDKFGRSLLDLALQSNSVEAVKLVLAKGVDPNAKDDLGKTTLHKIGSPRNLPILLDAGANVNVRDKGGVPPVFQAASRGELELVEAFLAAGADVDAAAFDGTTLLHHVAKRSSKILERVLARRPKSVDVQDASGMTPLHWAARVGHPGSIKVLVQAGARMDLRDKDGNTATHLAVQSADRSSLYLLVGSGADPAVRNAAGKTAADLIHEPPDIWAVGEFFFAEP